MDEYNNGFNDREIPFLIYVAHLTRDYTRSIHHNEPFGRKKYGSDRKKDREFIERALSFTNHHPQFFYVAIKKEDYNLITRSLGIASLIAKFLSRHPDLNRRNTVVAIDKIDGSDSTKFVKDNLETFLKHEDISIPLFFQEHGDFFNGSIRAADSIAYYIAGLKRRNPKRWPYKYNRIPLDFIIKNSLHEDDAKT